MVFLKKLRKKFIVSLAILLFAANSAGAAFYSVPEEFIPYGQKIYEDAKTASGRGSFRGYCGTYVAYQLRVMGIFKDRFDVTGNGNQWYSNFNGITKTSGGYYVYRESGGDCIDKLVAKYGSNLKNIVLSFPIQAGYSASNPGAGHTFMIYELRDGIAYYSESFAFGSYKEGQVVAEDINSLLSRYGSRHGTVTGCVMLSQQEPEAIVKNELKLSLDDAMKLSMQSIFSVAVSAEEYAEITKSRAID